MQGELCSKSSREDINCDLVMEGMIMIKSHLKGTGFYEEEWSDVAGVLL